MISPNILTERLPVIVLVGPTAVGKTALSLELSEKFNCEIISVDSMQVYRYMDIGTAKVTPTERARVPHHLIDIIDPDEQYDAARFVRDAWAAVNLIHGSGKIPLLAGGTGLYLRALTSGLFSALPNDPLIVISLKKRVAKVGIQALYRELAEYDPPSAARIHPNDEQRIIRALEILQTTGIPWSHHLQRQTSEKGQGSMMKFLQIGLTCDRATLYNRINNRCRQMINDGLEQEVYSLLAKGYGKELNSLNAIGYRHIMYYIEGSLSLQDTIDLLARDTRRYAKRQYTWFNKSKEIEWFDVNSGAMIFERIGRWIGEFSNVQERMNEQ